MNTKALIYAKLNIDIVAEENGFKSFTNDGKLYIEFPSGRNFELSEREIIYQANEYLENEKRIINNY